MKKSLKEYDEILKRATKVNEARDEKLNRKDYLITAFVFGCDVMSFGKSERKISPRRYFVPVSLNEIEQYIGMMKRGFWEHPDLKSDGSNADDIPHEEKKWGRYSNIVIEPLSEELEKDYVGSSKLGFFKNHREILQWEEEKGVA